MHMKRIATSLLLLVLIASGANSQTRARESFTGPLGKNLGGVENGWAGPWVPIEGTSVATGKMFIVADTAFDYNDQLNYPIANSGHHAIGQLVNAWDWQRYARRLADSVVNTKGKVLWLSFVVQYQGWPNDNGWGFVSFYNRVDSINKWNEGPGAGYSWQAKLAMGTFVDWSTWPPTPLAGNTGISNITAQGDPHWIVVKVVLSGDTLSRAYMFVDRNPAGAEPDTASADAKTDWNLLNGFRYIVLHMGGDGAGKEMKVDEICFDTTYAGLASPMVKESFDAPVGTNLGSVESGWAGPWVPIEGTSVATGKMFGVADTTFDYNDQLNYPIANAGHHAIGQLVNAWDWERYTRKLADSVVNTKGKVLWLSFVAQYQAWPNDNGWGFVSFYNFSKGATVPTDTIYKWREGPGAGYSWQPKLAMGTFVDWSTWPPTPLAGNTGISNVTALGDPHWIVVKVVLSGDTLSRAYMFVDRNPGGPEPDTASADAKTDWNLLNGFRYIAVHMGGDGAGKLMKVDEICFDTTYVGLSIVNGVPNTTSLPSQFELFQNYPNPFNPSSTISFTLAKAGNVRLSVYDLLGREVAVLVDGHQDAGAHQVVFRGERFGSGVYFYRLQSHGGDVTKKMMLIK
jgi:hypothetical protein